MAETFQQGWSYYSKAASAGVAANAGQQYCANVQSAIDTFAEEMQSMVEQH